MIHRFDELLLVRFNIFFSSFGVRDPVSGGVKTIGCRYGERASPH